MTQKSQYASTVIDFSSQYNDSFSAKQALGNPNATAYGDIAYQAWTSSGANVGLQTLTLGFDTAVYANGVSIWESNANGFVTKIEVLSKDNHYSVVWRGNDNSPATKVTEFSIPFTKTDFLVKGVRITVDTDTNVGYEEIDAVQLRGEISLTNQPPIDIALFNIDENVPAGTEVGTFNTIDPDLNDTFVYQLVSGVGDSDLFSIVGNKLKIKSSPDFETHRYYSIRISTTDQEGLSFERAVAIAVNDLPESITNNPPTNISLSNATIDENVAANTVVGTLSSVDSDANDSFTYTLIAGEGDNNNAAFTIIGSTLKIMASPDFEKQDGYVIRVKTTDSAGESFERNLVIKVNDVSEPLNNNKPTDLILSKTDIDENVAVNSVVGKLTSTDPDAGDSFSYSLVSGTGSDDNSVFNIVNNELRINESPNFESQKSYSIRLRTTDSGDLTFDKTITIAVNDLNNSNGQPIYGDANNRPTADKLDGTDANEKMYGLNMNDTLYGNSGNDTVYGGNADDSLYGGAGNDELYGDVDNDYLNGGIGNDVLDGGTGVDTLVGGDGSDIYYLGYDALDVITDNGLVSDVDTVIMPYQIKRYSLGTGIEDAQVFGSGGGSLIGNAIDNTLKGSDGNNLLVGNAGSDTLLGDAGNDNLQGGKAVDALNGSTGNDTLNGGAGGDDLSGGTGKDAFRFTNTDAIDNISDFIVTDDSIQLENNVFTALISNGKLASDAFYTGNSATTASEKIIYNANTGAIYYDEDGSGSHLAVQIATIGVNLDLTSADFIVT